MHRRYICQTIWYRERERERKHAAQQRGMKAPCQPLQTREFAVQRFFKDLPAALRADVPIGLGGPYVLIDRHTSAASHQRVKGRGAPRCTAACIGDRPRISLYIYIAYIYTRKLFLCCLLGDMIKGLYANIIISEIHKRAEEEQQQQLCCIMLPRSVGDRRLSVLYIIFIYICLASGRHAIHIEHHAEPVRRCCSYIFFAIFSFVTCLSTIGR